MENSSCLIELAVDVAGVAAVGGVVKIHKICVNVKWKTLRSRPLSLTHTRTQ